MVGSCEVALWAYVHFGLVCLHRFASVCHPPVTSPWCTRLRVETRGRVAPSAARPVPGASPSWGESRRLRGLDHGGLADSEGSPGLAPSRGPPGGPNQGRVGGARKAGSEKKSKRKAQANAVFLSGISDASSVLKGRTSGGPVLSVLSLLSGGPTPDEWEVNRGPPTSAAAHSGRQCGVSTIMRLV